MDPQDDLCAEWKRELDPSLAVEHKKHDLALIRTVSLVWQTRIRNCNTDLAVKSRNKGLVSIIGLDLLW